MKKQLPVFLVPWLAIVGCQDKPVEKSVEKADFTQSNGTTVVPVDLPAIEERAPKFPAEIHVESRAPGKGISRFSASMHSSHHSVNDGGDATVDVLRSTTESSEMNFNLLDGRVCKILRAMSGTKTDGMTGGLSCNTWIPKRLA